MLIYKYFEDIAKQHDYARSVVSSQLYFKHHVNERDALTRAVRPFVLIRQQRHLKLPESFSMDRVLELLKECFTNPRNLFRNVYPDLYTEFTFPGIQTFF